MKTQTWTERAPRPTTAAASPTLWGWLGRPLAFVATAAIVLAAYAWPFIVHPERAAPTKDPAYYTWRTEALISEEPATLLRLEGAFDMFAGGYRIAAPVMGAFLRQIAGVSQLRVTVVLMVLIPVLTALLLAGFAYRELRHPLVFHVVAFATASLYLSPPFVGYLDNILCLFFLAASLPFIPRVRDSWSARVAFASFLLLAGLTHPTTLAIFVLTLGAMAGARVVFRRFDWRSLIAHDGPLLATAAVSVALTYLVWAVGVWGPSASLGEAALPPPYGSAFFLDRLGLWVDALRPAVNGPLFVIGLVAIVAMGRDWVDNDLARVAVLWLAPLVGLFGFLAGIAYPYYRFFNTTLAWLLFIGLGGFFLVTLLARARPALGWLGIVAVGVVFVTNYTTLVETSGWSDPENEWLSRREATDLRALHAALERTDDDRPVVFVIDDEQERPFQIWGFTKLAGNTARFGLPRGQIDEAYLYLGSLGNYFDDRPTTRGQDTYDRLSPALLDYLDERIDPDDEPIVVVASIFNERGANTDIATGTTEPPAVPDDTTVWSLHDGRVTAWGSPPPAPGGGSAGEGRSGPGHILWLVAAAVVLLLPGALAYRWFVPDGDLAAALGLVPALAIAMLTLMGIAVLAVTRAPFSIAVAWVTVAVALALGALAWWGSSSTAALGRSRPAPGE